MHRHNPESSYSRQAKAAERLRIESNQVSLEERGRGWVETFKRKIEVSWRPFQRQKAKKGAATMPWVCSNAHSGLSGRPAIADETPLVK